MTNRVRYTRQNVISNSFYQLPKFLFDTEFAGLTNDARVLYALLRNRHEISIKNEWYDGNGEVFLYFKREDMQDILHLSENTIAKTMKDLKAYSLIEEERQGFAKPNKIYLLSAIVPALGIEVPEPITAKFEVMDETPKNQHTRKIYGTETADFTAHEPQNLRVNHNNKNHNDFNKCVSENEPAPTENTYGEFKRVRMAVSQYDALVTAYGRDKTTDYINRLDRHIASVGKHYKDHFATIKKWIDEDSRKQVTQPPPKQNKFCNYDGREWDFDELERLERQHLNEK